MNSYLNHRVLSYYYYKFRDVFFNQDSVSKKIQQNGFYVFEKKFPLEKFDLFKYYNFDSFNFLQETRYLEHSDVKKIYKELLKLDLIQFIKNYLGNDLYCYGNKVLTLGSKTNFSGAWQPHHDSKGRRLKIYIWLTKLDKSTHPLYYKKLSHKKLNNWKNGKETRFPYLHEDEFTKIYGDKGTIIVFDTHGIHSHFKKSTSPRSVIDLTFEGFGKFNRLHPRNILSESEKLGLIKLDNLLV